MEGVMLSHYRLRALLPLGGLIACMLLLFAVSCSDSSTGPGASSDFWASATPESQNMDGEMLKALTEKIEAGDFGDINSLVIVKNGKLVYEQYFNGSSRNDLNLAASVTMNVSSTLIGCAIDDGLLSGLDEKIMPMFIDLGIIENGSPWKGQITVGDLLEMKSGFEWDELSKPLDHVYNDYFQMVSDGDYYRYVLGRPMACEPGTVWNYNTGSAVLLERVIENATGMTAAQYAEERLFGPLGIKDYKWYKWFPDAKGIPNTANGLNLRAVDMAKIAYLYMNDGMWDGKQVVSSEWINQATMPTTDFGDHGYGLLWWVAYIDDGGATRYMPCASGYGDQNIMYCRDFDLVIVTQADNIKNTASSIAEIVTDYIKPSINEQ